MTILDFVGISANLNLISAESFLEPIDLNDKKEPKERQKRTEADDERQSDDSEKSEGRVQVDIGISRIASGIQSRTVFGTEEFDPFEATGLQEESIQLKSTLVSNDLLSDKQYNLLKKMNICDDPNLKKAEAQKIVAYIAGKRFRLTSSEKEIARKLYRDVKG